MKELKKKYKIVLIAIFSLICLIGIIYSSINIYKWIKDTNSNKDIKEEIDKNIVVDKEKDVYKIDFKTLKKKNPDTVAYIKVNGTNIDYVIVRGTDNEYYLKHNFNKEYNIAGWIYSDYRNKFDESDKNIVIFGHDTKDGSMFGTLSNVLDNKWSNNKDNLIVTLVTEKNKYKYQVFSTYSIVAEDYYINTEFNSNEEFDEFIKELKSRSTYDYGIEVSGDDKILTLSSCIGDGTKRVVLHAKLI